MLTSNEFIYTAVPYPKDPAPAQLTMPDFSKNALAGWSAGESAHDLQLQLLVIEEWGNGEVSLHISTRIQFYWQHANDFVRSPPSVIGYIWQTSILFIMRQARGCFELMSL